MILDVGSDHLSAVIKGTKYRVLQYSRGFKEKLTKLKEKGYLPHSAIVRFIVAWKNKNYDEELPIVLADISFKKTQQQENTL